MRSGVLAAVVCLVGCGMQAASAEDQPLTGKVRTSRVQRPPLSTLKPSLPQQTHTGLNDSHFSKVPVGITESPVETAGTQEAAPAKLQETVSQESTPVAPAQPAQQPVINSGSGNSTPATTTATVTKFPSKSITIRLKRFRSLNDMEVVWEAANLANKMRAKGADVTVLLDMEAVNAANRHNTMGAQFQLHRGGGGGGDGGGNERLISVQELLQDFTAHGGKLLVAQRWVRFNMMSDALVPGAELIDDDQLADHLLETGNILDY